MAITIQWDTPEKRAIRYDFDAQWTWDDLIAAAEADDAMLNEVEHTVDLIFNLSAMRSVPPQAINRLSGLGRMLSVRTGAIILVGDDHWARTVLDIFYRVYGSSEAGLSGVHAVHTLDEARALVGQSSAPTN